MGMGCFHSAVKTHAKHDMKRLGEGIEPELNSAMFGFLEHHRYFHFKLQTAITCTTWQM